MIKIEIIELFLAEYCISTLKYDVFIYIDIDFRCIIYIKVGI